MLSIQQHRAMNAQYANETFEWAVVQIWLDGRWRDFSRTDIGNAKCFVERQPQRKYRVVDWLTKEEINLNSFFMLRDDEGDGAGHLHAPTHQIPYPKH